MSTSTPGFGAWVQPDGRTRFRLWAPSAPPTLALEIEGRAPIPLVPDAEGYAETVVDCGPGTRYRYRLDDDTLVPDPASRLQDGDVHDASVVVAPDQYAWRHPDWRGRPWEDTVIYEVHPGLAGGYAGLAARLPALAAMGVTMIELMPIADFPGPRNWGYDGVLPYAPDAAYGSPDELRALIDSAHGLGLSVMLDVVYNHFGPDGNYLPRYAAPFFNPAAQTPWGAAIDFGQPAVRRYFAESALHWLNEYRFDGLRLDAVHAIARDEWLIELAAQLRAGVDPRRQLHLVLENDDNRASLLRAGYDAQWNDDAHHVLHHLLTGEADGYYSDYSTEPATLLARCLSEGFVFQGQPSAFRGGQPRGEPSAALAPTAFVLFLQNHDQTGNRALGERLQALVQDPQRLRAAVALQLLSAQIPLLFMGEETGTRVPFQYFTSHDNAELAQAVRDGRKREFAAFMARHDVSALPDPNAAATFMASRPDLVPAPGEPAPHPRAADWIDYYTTLLQLRARLITPRLRGAQALGAQPLGPAAVQASWRLADGAQLSLYANLGEAEAVLPPPLRKLVNDAQTEIAFESHAGAARQLAAGVLAPASTVCLLTHGTHAAEAP
ncbi:MAG: malto-oligosyltrehalose trehalohydrolase [Bordetella sp.]|nr:malto-oligosyltrehalose trehalohydrolase [Bordetella sp.]